MSWLAPGWKFSRYSPTMSTVGRGLERSYSTPFITWIAFRKPFSAPRMPWRSRPPMSRSMACSKALFALPGTVS